MTIFWLKIAFQNRITQSNLPFQLITGLLEVQMSNSPFLLKEDDSYKAIAQESIYIRELNSISNYRSMATNEPYQANFKAVVHNELGLYPCTITILYCDMLEAMQLLNEQHKYIAARVIEAAYHIIKNSIEFERQILN